ncbi:hypothetical protein [Ensifer aridi]|uniref:hypothetical protein n=1 Tax=Ensifer aridi TaxID=1708715 RepID=UPI00111BF992|nr:hypothetical protein [Ensifer aridi]
MSNLHEIGATLPGFDLYDPFQVMCLYRVQSQRKPEPGSLCGAIVSGGGTISSAQVNAVLRRHKQWKGQAQVQLKPIAVSARAGVFSRHEDALYYQRNFRDVRGGLPASDLLDVTKLKRLFAERLPILSSVFVPDALEWLTSCLGRVEVAAINEYMCHEAGHCMGVAIGHKEQKGYFRAAGKLVWPLIFTEEYRADVNAWALAVFGLSKTEAVSVIAYTLMHRIGLAALNLTQGRPGVGFVPFLHFASMVEAGFIRLIQSTDGIRMDFCDYDRDRLLDAAMSSAVVVDQEINSRERTDDQDCGREAMLEFSVARLRRNDLAGLFAKTLGRSHPVSGNKSTF